MAAWLKTLSATPSPTASVPCPPQSPSMQHGLETLQPSTGHPADRSCGWQHELRQAYRHTAPLLQALNLDAATAPAWFATDDTSFPLLVPHSYALRMQPGNWDDPLLRQVLLNRSELQPTEAFASDAVGDTAARIAPGLLQKYRGRALLITTGACAVHCRYCFRRHYPYSDDPKTLKDWQPALQQIADDSSLHEILLSGGDPLLLTDGRLEELIAALAEIAHVRRLRIHTRLPIVLPTRMTDRLLGIFTGSRLQPWTVVHANHPAEVAGDCAAALQRLIAAGIPTLNQAVLLRGVNDDVATLTELCERLIDLGIQPYYLHQLDRVAGAAHFEVPVERGRQLVAELRRQLPGYAVPLYVQEQAGEPHKTPL